MIHQDTSEDPSGVTRSGEFSPQKDPTGKIQSIRFEYLRLQLSTQNIKSGVKRINELGHAGWELVSIASTSSQDQAFMGSGATQELHLYFKRPLVDASEGYIER